MIKVFGGLPRFVALPFAVLLSAILLFIPGAPALAEYRAAMGRFAWGWASGA